MGGFSNLDRLRRGFESGMGSERHNISLDGMVFFKFGFVGGIDTQALTGHSERRGAKHRKSKNLFTQA